MTDGGGPASHVLYQDFVVPAGPPSSMALRFDLFIGNRASFGFSSPDTLDFSIADPNQQVRVDILLAGSDPFSLDPADLLMNVDQSLPGDPLVSGYTTITADLTSLLSANPGQTLRLRFAQVDNFNGPLQMGVDNVTLNAVPEP